jgi:3-hydroxyisobutyrate dehydrogenase-like beta-hydroxyacid dehydrogenase
MSASSVGFVGLGNMGSVLAANLVQSGHDVVTYDVAGPSRNPEGARFVPSVDDVGRGAAVVVLSLPDGTVSEVVCRALVDGANRRVTHVVDTSTSGVAAARAISALLSEAGMGYVDAPVSGGPAGARSRTLTVMFAGSEDACAAVEPVLAGLSDRRVRVGALPGMAQAVKLANNFLSATALAATSEAIAFGRTVGLDMKTMLDVLNASSGQNTATSDKFPNHVLNGRFASGFANVLMSKDLRLYLGAVEAQGAPTVLGPVTAQVWERFAEMEPGADFTRIYPFVEGTAQEDP